MTSESDKFIKTLMHRLEEVLDDVTVWVGRADDWTEEQGSYHLTISKGDTSRQYPDPYIDQAFEELTAEAEAEDAE